MKYFGKLAVLGAALAVSASSAFATSITPGMSGTVAVASLSSFTGGTLVTSTGGTLTDTDFSAAWTEQVYNGASSASMCSTCLEFVFNFGPNSGPQDLVQLAVSYFISTYATDVYYVTGSGIAPTSVGDAVNGTVSFNYNPDIPSTKSSDELVILTNATTTTAGEFSLQDGSSQFATDYGPSGPTGFAPEPSSLMLLGTGLVGAAGMLMRRRQHQQQTAA